MKKQKEIYRFDIRKFFSLFLLPTFILILSGIHSHSEDKKGFVIFENLTFSGSRPDFSSFGFEHLAIVDPHTLGYDVPDRAKAQEAISKVRPNGYLVIDIEHWPLTNQDAANSLSRYEATLDIVRKVTPNVKIGLYNVLPVSDYWRAIGARGQSALNEWRFRNDDIARVLISHVDAIFPSIYTPYGDKDAWITYATANLKEARRISQGKPVYCFLFPQFPKTLAFLPGDFWYTELATCAKYADGAVIWGTSAPGPTYSPMRWDPDAEWWQATLRFIRETNIQTPLKRNL